MNLNRNILIDCCADGTLTYRPKGQGSFNGAALPVTSVDTEAEAEQLLVLVGKSQIGEHPQWPGKVWYAVPHLVDPDDVGSLANVSEVLEEAYARIAS